MGVCGSCLSGCCDCCYHCVVVFCCDDRSRYRYRTRRVKPVPSHVYFGAQPGPGSSVGLLPSPVTKEPEPLTIANGIKPATDGDGDDVSGNAVEVTTLEPGHNIIIHREPEPEPEQVEEVMAVEETAEVEAAPPLRDAPDGEAEEEEEEEEESDDDFEMPTMVMSASSNVVAVEESSMHLKTVAEVVQFEDVEKELAAAHDHAEEGNTKVDLDGTTDEDTLVDNVE